MTRKLKLLFDECLGKPVVEKLGELLTPLGHKPPAPARTGTRTQQVNVRLTPEERALLEATAKQKGYHGLSDFLRAVAIEATK